ncbi:hypothetical protein JKF63_07196 [Porcisia hertigi]|uniref:Uncharacterized protein n=1 Tax=Porcisia hertigi TaxID=2761500 RepID=A0A836LKI1_9TRYP|nr:hypothetical protein JKF63_07196 [Porcisia hertigi]
MASTSGTEIAKRIREGNQKRKEKERKKQQLEQEYLEGIANTLNEDQQNRSATRFLPSILICLLFVSLPLSEQVVDWCLVGIFCLLNTLLACIFTNPSEWGNIASTVLVNFLLVRFSTEIYSIPQRLRQVSPFLLAVYVTTNVLIGAAAYFLYVSPRLLRFLRSCVVKRREKSSSAKHKNHHSNEHDVLEAFAMRKAEAERLDILLCLLLLFNLALLIYLDVIPLHLVLQNGLNVFRLLQ